MKRVSSHLSLARRVRISNAWLLTSPSGDRFLVDTGHPTERPALRHHLARAGVRRPGDLAGVFLTHRHSDHAGNAAWVRRTYDCPIYCHSGDAPYLRGERPPPRLATRGKRGWARVLCHVEDRFPARVPVDVTMEDGEEHHGFTVFHVPGHTDGSVLLHHGPTRTLFTGDAIIGGPPPARLLERIRLSIAEFSQDVGLSHASVRDAVRRLPPTETLASGHGPAVREGVDDKLRALADRPVLRPRLAARYSTRP